jgi:Mannosyltransferase (PIG-V)
LTTSGTTAAESARAEERARIRRGLLYCLGVFAAMRVGLSLVGLIAAGLLEPLPAVGAPGWAAPTAEPGWQVLFTAWERFDGLWFLSIASNGYVDGNGSAAFFPGYPLLIRAVSPLLGGHPLAAALLVSTLAAFGSMVVLFFLTTSELDEGAARRTVLYLALFPTAFFLLAPYSEAPFLLFALLSLWAARRQRWAVAGLAAAVASATRSIGVVLLIPLVAEAISQRRESGEPLAGKLAWSALAPAGAVAYALFWQAFAGDALAPIHQQATWQRELAFAPASVVDATYEGWRFPGLYPGGYHLLDWVIVVPALVAGVWVARHTRPAFGLYTWLSILVPLSFTFGPRPFMSLPRFLVVAFPVLWAFAAWGPKRRGIHEAVVASFAGLQVLMLVLFVNWYYVF